MSQARSGANISEFFNDDDSERLRLVDFFKQMRRDVPKQKFLFMDCETDRLSFDVQLEKLPTPQNKNVVLENGKVNKNLNVNDTQLALDSPAADNIEFSKPRSTSGTQHAGVNNIRPIRSTRSNRSAIRESVGDRLRRLCIKNNTATELAEDENFNPSIFSTPNSKPTQTITNNLTEIENVEPDIPNNPRTTSVLQSKDAELNHNMASLKEIRGQLKTPQDSSTDNASLNRNRNSIHLKRKFTIEKGSVLGQFVATSDTRNNKICNLQQSPKQKKSKSKILTSEHSRQDCSSLSKNYSNKQDRQESELQKVPNKRLVISNSSQNSLPQNVEILETQDQTIDNNLPNGSAREQHVPVVPANQTANKSPQTKSCTPIVQNYQQLEDSLKLTDILTDDEDCTPKSTLQSAQNVKEKPLDLAPSSYSLCKKRQRKRTSLKLNLHGEAAEVETAYPADSNTQTLIRKCNPLNSPPGTPLNGEMYAQEFARMSNYQILDLRKRNSMDRIFVISGRRSRRSLEEVNIKKLELENQIEQELSKRSLDNTTQHPICQLDEDNMEDGSVRDTTLAAQMREQKSSKDSCFIDEKSTDRVKFKSNKRNDRLSRENRLPKVLKQYLEVSKRYSGKKQRKSTNRKNTRRSLFNIQNLNKSYERAEGGSSCSRLKKLSGVHLNSPQPPAITSTSEMQNTSIQTHRGTVVATSTTTTGNIQNTRANVHSDLDASLTLLPPPAGFEGDSVVVSATKNDSIHTNANANNDDNFFKKPVNPPPKKRSTKKGKTVKVLQESRNASGSADLTAGGSLRRSTRGQVPLCIPPIVVEFHQQEIMRQAQRERQREIRIKKKKQEEKLIRKLNKMKTKNTKSQQATVTATVGVVAESEKESMSQKNDQCSSRLEYDSRSPQIECLHNLSGQLQQNSLTANATITPIITQPKVKPLKVRVRRSTHSETAPTAVGTTVSSTTVSSTSTLSSTNSNIDLVSWLKNVGKVCSSDQQTSNAFNETRVSHSTNFRFVEYNGLEYGFYDTADKASLGYLRFKPRQRKPKKRAKHFQLNFVNILGSFRIRINREEKVLAEGDLAIVEKMANYDIENLSDDVGILMVIKK